MSQAGNSGYNSVSLGTATNSVCMTEGERALKTDVRALFQKDHQMSEPAAQTPPLEQTEHKHLFSEISSFPLQPFL